MIVVTDGFLRLPQQMRLDVVPSHALDTSVPGAPLRAVVGGLDAAACGGVEEDAVGANQLQPVPGHRVVTGGEDEGGVGLQLKHHQLGRRRGRHAQVEHVTAGGAQRVGGDVRKACAGGPCITRQDDPGADRQFGGQGMGEAAHGVVGERIADDAADPGDADDERCRTGQRRRSTETASPRCRPRWAAALPSRTMSSSKPPLPTRAAATPGSTSA